MRHKLRIAGFQVMPETLLPPPASGGNIPSCVHLVGAYPLQACACAGIGKVAPPLPESHIHKLTAVLPALPVFLFCLPPCFFVGLQGLHRLHHCFYSFIPVTLTKVTWVTGVTMLKIKRVGVAFTHPSLNLCQTRQVLLMQQKSRKEILAASFAAYGLKQTH